MLQPKSGARRALLGGLCAATALFVLPAIHAAPAAAADRTKLSVYTALENDQLQPFKQGFEADNPDVEIAWVRDSTGVITARFLAEKANPQADVVWGLAVTSIIQFADQGLIEPYAPKGADQLKAGFVSTANPPLWTGMDAFLSFACVNKVELEKAKVALPTSWADLTNPALKGQLVMPNPASSGTGYLTVAAWIQSMGEEKAWAFMDKLHENMAVYTHSGSAPCAQAAKGERTIGIGLDMRGVTEKAKGAPLELVLPSEGLGWDLEATAIVKGTKHLDAAKKLADWSVTPKANALYGKTYAIVANKGVDAKPANYPAAAEPLMVKNDFGWMAANRDRILAEWTKRYDGKSAPKS